MEIVATSSYSLCVHAVWYCLHSQACVLLNNCFVFKVQDGCSSLNEQLFNILYSLFSVCPRAFLLHTIQGLFSIQNY